MIPVPAAISYVRSHRNRKDGTRVILIPFFLFLTFALVRIAVGSSSPQSSTLPALTGILVVLGMMFLIMLLLGTLLFFKKELPVESAHDKRSGRGRSSQHPPEILRWNWGAAGLGIVWGVYHRSWWTLLNVIAPLNLIWWIVLGAHGNAWAWSKDRWTSVEEFQASQRKWESYGLACFVVKVIVVVGVIVRAATM